MCLSSDARFCEELGTPLEAYREYRVRHARPAISVSWLPASVDLASMVMQADFDTEALRQKQREKWEEKAVRQGAQGAPQKGGKGGEPESSRKAQVRASPAAPTLWDAVDSECVIELPER